MESLQGHAKIAGGSVYYLKAPPQLTADLKNELRVLEAFLAAWNANALDNPKETKNPDAKPQKPSDSNAYPAATRLLVTSANHSSDKPSSSGQAKHISAMVCTDENWKLKQKEDVGGGEPYHEYGALVHVFANNQDPAQGYKDFWIFQTRRRNLTNKDTKQEIANAEARNLGTLGEGDLA